MKAIYLNMCFKKNKHFFLKSTWGKNHDVGCHGLCLKGLILQFF